jgi:hypothetical protein
MGGEDAVGEDEIDAGARSQGGELFEELEGLEKEMARAVSPGALELQPNAAVPGEPEAILSDRGSKQVAAELLEPSPVGGRYAQVSVEVEAVEMRVTGPGRRHPGGVRIVAEAPERLRELPPLLRAVSDEPGVLSLAEGQALSRRISQIERDAGVKMIAVVVVTVAPESIEAYGQRLINHWKRHSRALDNDRFVFILIAKNDREVRIVPSETLAWVLKPFMNSGIMPDARTLLKQDKYFEALVAMVDKISQLIGVARGVVLNGKSETTDGNVRPRYQDARFG